MHVIDEREDFGRKESNNYYKYQINSMINNKYPSQVPVEEGSASGEPHPWGAYLGEGGGAAPQPDLVWGHRRLHLQGHLTGRKRHQDRPPRSHVSNTHTHPSFKHTHTQTHPTPQRTVELNPRAHCSQVQAAEVAVDTSPWFPDSRGLRAYEADVCMDQGP